MIREGALRCVRCEARYPIIRSIPRFVPIENYASGFGLEWTIHARTQYDSHTGLPLSERRFFEETRWPRRMPGETIIEAGSGSGRFTEQAASTGALILSVDYSYGVEANYHSNGHHPNVLIVQADIYRLPIRIGYADRAVCIGVLQHTPDPRRAFLSLVEHVKLGGEVVVDVYRKSFVSYVLGTKYWVRPITRHIPPERLYGVLRRYVDVIWPVACLVRRIPRIGVALNWRLLVADSSKDGLRGQLLKEWAYLDTFDMLAPRYDYPQTARRVRSWFTEAGLTDIEVGRGYNGIEGRGRRPRAAPAPGYPREC